MNVKKVFLGALSVIAVIIALSLGNSIGKLANQVYAEIRQPAILGKQEFLTKFEKTLSNNELMRIVQRTFPEDYSKFLDAVYVQYRDGEDMEIVKTLAHDTARAIRNREGALALKANEEDILAIFSLKLFALQTARNSNSSLCVKYIKGDTRDLTLEQIKLLRMESESVLVFRAIESGQTAQKSYAELTDAQWERILFGGGDSEFSDDELNAISDPKFLAAAPSELVCRSWTKLYEAVGRQELEIRVRFMVSMMKDAIKR